MLVNIYGSSELFVNEYRTMLADRLLSITDYDTDKEVYLRPNIRIRTEVGGFGVTACGAHLFCRSSIFVDALQILRLLLLREHFLMGFDTTVVVMLLCMP